MANTPLLPPSSLYSIVLTTFLLVAPVVLALPPLTSEQHRRAPGLTTMVALSPLVISGYTLLAVLTSYTVLRLFRFFKARFVSATQAPLPQPVSAGRTSSFYSLLSFLRPRRKLGNTTATAATTKSKSTRSRWHLLSYIYRRLARPLSPLHLSGAELLPTTAPGSPSANAHSLIDLPTMSGSPAPVSKGWGQRSKQTQQPLRSPSMEALPSYRPLTPVPVLVPLPAYTIPAPPSTPPPPTPASVPGMIGSDIPLVPITPPKRQYTPANTMNSGGLPTPPLANTFPAVSLSPFKPNNTTVTPSNPAVDPRSSSPSPQLFLSSRTLSSLSLSPRSLYMQQQRRSKSLGGVVVKKVSQPHFDLDEFQPEQTRDVVDSIETVMNNQSQSLIMSALENREEAKETKGKPMSVPPTVRPPKFLLNFSSSSSSSTSDSSLSSDLLSASPLNSNTGSTPASAPLETPRTVSYSSDVAKPSEYEPLLPHPIPLVDIDMNVATGVTPGFDNNDKAAGWSFDIEGQENVGPRVENVLVDFESPVAVSLPSYTKASLVDLKLSAGGKEDRLIEVEDVDAEVNVGFVPKEEWGWDNDLEVQGSWDVYSKHEEVTAPHSDWDLEDGGVMSEDEDDSVVPPSPSPRTATPLKEPSMEATTNEEMEVEHPDPDFLPLPEAIDISPPIIAEAAEAPIISICTQDTVLCRKVSDCDSDTVSVSSTGRRTPISPGQIPTPPASPPREVRTTPLPKVNKDLNKPGPNKSAVDLPVEEDPVTVDASAAPQELLPVVEQVEESSSSLAHDTEAQVSVEAIEENEEVGGEMKKILDRPLVHSPAAMSVVLEEPEEEDEEERFTFNVEPADEDIDGSSDSESRFEVEVVPPSPCDGVVAWEYEFNDEEEGAHHPRTSPGLSEGNYEVAEQEEERLKQGRDVRSDVEDAGTASVGQDGLQNSTSSGAESPLLEPKEAAPLPVSEVISAPFEPPVLKPSTSLPGSFPDGTSSPKLEPEPKPEPQSLPAETSPQPQPRRRIRTPLEEAIARTRSPLEVALAMQLRPGLGVGADPAWMVRFLMVMWGWVFGLVLVPSAEA